MPWQCFPARCETAEGDEERRGERESGRTKLELP
jgi:hypothetical protein